MGQSVWHADSSGRYVIDIALGSTPLTAMIDLGLVDKRGRVGLVIDPLVYDRLKSQGSLQNIETRRVRYASGKASHTESGRASLQLIDPASRLLVGPVVHLHISRGLSRMPNCAGGAFFHGLTGCRVIWDLHQRTWTVEFP